jgi:hypothetical protein
VTDPPAYRRDKHGRALAEYPERTEYGHLIGINAFGNAAYATERTATLASLDEEGRLRVPVRERWIAREFPLAEAGLSPTEYVEYVVEETGPWRALTDGVEERLQTAGHDLSLIVSAGSFTAELDGLIEAVQTRDGAASEASGALRQYALDHPAEVVSVVPRLLDLQESYAGANDDFDALAVAADLAAVVARATRADPGTVATHLDRIVAVVGRERKPAGDDPTLLHLIDALDVLGRDDPEGLATALATDIENDDDDDDAIRTLNALYRLEHRYSTGQHPLLEIDPLRQVVAAAAERATGELREAAQEVETIHGFHR